MKYRKPGECEVCGAPTPRMDRKFCDLHMVAGRAAAIAESNSRRWRQWKAAGIDPCHTPEARALIGEAVARANSENPKRRRQVDHV